MPDTPSIFSVSPYSRAIAREMYPGQLGQDDQQDAARHMLAAGTMARKYGPTVADLAGKAHEYSTSPLRALMMMLGRGEMPPDYKQDMHNNALGIELARRAQSQSELEDLVQQAAERSAKTQNEGRPWISKAKGGEVDADELNRPYIGYRSAGRRPESQQDRRAATDAPLAALRGVASGVLGAPGDIESLVRMLPGMSERTIMPTSEDVERRLPLRSVSETPVGRAATAAGQIGGGFYTGPGSPLRAIAGLPSAVSRAGRDFAMAAGQPAVNVVKPKGGNWMSGSVERVVNPMQQTVLNETGLQNLAERAGADVSESVRARQLPEAAMNRWLETKLGKYIKNEMATPEDPVRALAERGVLHVDPEQLNFRPELHGRFMSEGQTAVAQSPAAKSWEGASDLTVGQMPAGQLLQQGYAEQMPWLAKVPPETPVYMPSQSGMADDLGFGHLVDELRNAVNPESGLPANLRLKYQDLEKVTVPQAVERVAKINEWRAAQKAEADMARAMNPATQVVKEYPDQGFKWVELRQPKELPEGWSEARPGVYNEPSGYQGYEHPGIKSLEDALKYEGETMGHCVGGYCPDVVEGRSKIFSLRDKKGQPHVTIEVAPGVENPSITEGNFRGRPTFIVNNQGNGFPTLEEAQDYARKISTPEIVQIKGKANRAPNAEYLPAVQDFVRSQNWSNVGDLKNAGLVDLHQAGVPAEMRGGQRFVTEDEYKDIVRKNAEGFAMGGLVQKYAEGGMVSGSQTGDGLVGSNIYNSDAKQDPASAYKFADGGFAGSVPGYAAGGQVSGANFPTDDFDPARIDAIVGDLHAMNAG